MSESTPPDFGPAFYELSNELRHHMKAPAKGGIEINNQKDRLILGLMDVAQFLKRVGFDGAVYEPFATLAAAMADTSRGVTHPLLATEVHNRPPDRSDECRLRAQVALAVECLVRAGKSRPEVGRIVVKHSDLNRITRQGAKLETSCLSWYDDLREGKNVNDVAVGVWEQACRQFFTPAAAEARTPKEWVSLADFFLY